MNPYAWVRRVQTALLEMGATEVVSGGARGGDEAGEIAATRLSGERVADIKIKRFPADWKNLGKGAGFACNAQMGEYADALIALPGGRGTQSMIEIARSKGLRVVMIG